MAARWAGRHPFLGRGRSARGERARQRRRLLRAGLCRARQPALGPVCARRHRGTHARRHGGEHRARSARIHRLPDGRRARRDGEPPRYPPEGGAARNDALMQFQADVLGVHVVRPRILETTALGAAYLAGLGTGYWKSAEELTAQWQTERVFEPTMDRGRAAGLLAGWRKAVERSKDWERRDG